MPEPSQPPNPPGVRVTVGAVLCVIGLLVAFAASPGAGVSAMVLTGAVVGVSVLVSSASRGRRVAVLRGLAFVGYFSLTAAIVIPGLILGVCACGKK